MKPKTEFQKQILDTLYSNGLDRLKAYATVKKIKVPKGRQERKNISSIVSQIIAENPHYVAHLEKKNEQRLSTMKESLIAQLQDTTDIFNTLVELAMLDRLSDVEQAKFDRLRRIISARDATKAVEVIGKMTGSFEPEKKEVTTKFTVEWGTAPPKQIDNTIDITPEEDE